MRHVIDQKNIYFLAAMPFARHVCHTMRFIQNKRIIGIAFVIAYPNLECRSIGGGFACRQKSI